MPKSITIKYGVGNSMSVQVATGTTIDQILNNQNYQGSLGFGANVVAKVDGEILNASYVPDDGEEISIENRAHEKAS
jgi:hypothetical protein